MRNYIIITHSLTAHTKDAYILASSYPKSMELSLFSKRDRLLHNIFFGGASEKGDFIAVINIHNILQSKEQYSEGKHRCIQHLCYLYKIIYINNVHKESHEPLIKQHS